MTIGSYPILGCIEEGPGHRKRCARQSWTERPLRLLEHHRKTSVGEGASTVSLAECLICPRQQAVDIMEKIGRTIVRDPESCREKPNITTRAPRSQEPDTLDSMSSEDSMITFFEEE